jgi:hypothetical protein
MSDEKSVKQVRQLSSFLSLPPTHSRPAYKKTCICNLNSFYIFQRYSYLVHTSPYKIKSTMNTWQPKFTAGLDFQHECQTHPSQNCKFKLSAGTVAPCVVYSIQIKGFKTSSWYRYSIRDWQSFSKETDQLASVRLVC